MPVTAPVRAYDVSAINVEISLNMWLDFYPGYMYVLTENIDKVREEETKNREARDKDGYDPGAVKNGLQSQWIQPLAIRGNQGDCVKILWAIMRLSIKVTTMRRQFLITRGEFKMRG